MTRVLFALTAALVLVAPTQAANKKAVVTIIAEPAGVKNKEYPHSALLIEYSDGKKEWLGFMPPHTGKGGLVDPSDRTEWVGSYVRFELDEGKVRAARKATVAKYEKLEWKALTCDCVSFTSDFCRETGLLRVTARPNLIPANLVTNLASMNTDLKPQHVSEVTRKTKLPWR